MTHLLEIYEGWVNSSAWVSTVIQFAILGCLGEQIMGAGNMRMLRRLQFLRVLLNLAVWALVGIYMKCMFLVTGASLTALHPFFEAHQMNFLIRAFVASVVLNVMLGPAMLILKRLLDRGAERLAGGGVSLRWQGLQGMMVCLLIVWVPLNTVSFMLPAAYQLGSAALFSLLFGVIVGFFKRKQ